MCFLSLLGFLVSILAREYAAPKIAILFFLQQLPKSSLPCGHSSIACFRHSLDDLGDLLFGRIIQGYIRLKRRGKSAPRKSFRPPSPNYLTESSFWRLIALQILWWSL